MYTVALRKGLKRRLIQPLFHLYLKAIDVTDSPVQVSYGRKVVIILALSRIDWGALKSRSIKVPHRIFPSCIVAPDNIVFAIIIKVGCRFDMPGRIIER